MATSATQEYWIRTDGDDSNGGGFDTAQSVASGNGFNYANQASAPFTWAHLSLSGGTLTDDDGTGQIDVSFSYNLINVPGQGYYLVTATPGANQATVTPCTGASTSFSAQPGKLGGAFRQPQTLNSGGGVSAAATPTPLVPGNIIHIRASGSGSVGSPDYTFSSYALFPDGNKTVGLIQWIAYNGTPYVEASQGLGWHNLVSHKFVGIYAYANGNTYAVYSPIWCMQDCAVVGCTLNANNYTRGFNGRVTNFIADCELIGGGSSSGNGINIDQTGNVIENCRIHGFGGNGIREENGSGTVGTAISGCIIYDNDGVGILLDTPVSIVSNIRSCTIDGNGSDGIRINNVVGNNSEFVILNCNITTNGGYGINLQNGSTTVNDRLVKFANYNNYYNNTSGSYNNISAGDHDLNIDPQYVDAGTGDFTPQNTSLIAAAPIPDATNYLYIGAIQPQGASVSSGGFSIFGSNYKTGGRM